MSQVTVRMYNVGFGDCFLVTVPTDDGKQRRILFDCGSMAKADKSIEQIAKKVIRDLGNKKRIDVVVCSHRHRDHISGFAKEGWEEVDVGEVWMPWTEDPDDEEATRIREAQIGLAAALERDAMLRLAGMAADDEKAALQAFAELAANSNVNEEAMDTLHNGFKGRHAIPRRFLPETDEETEELITTFTSDLLPGITIHVLGPSREEEVIRNIEPPAGKSYMQLASAFDDPEIDESGPQPFSSDWLAEGTYVSDADRAKIKKFSHGFNSMIAAALDDAVNGTSLMLVLEVKGKHFLFSGDAQWGTWNAAMKNAKSRQLLKRSCFYKIGHHGSHNATPIEFVEQIMDQNLSVVAMASARKFGSWEHPLQKLLDEMAARNARIARSDQPDQAAAPLFTVEEDVIETKIDV